MYCKCDHSDKMGMWELHIAKSYLNSAFSLENNVIKWGTIKNQLEFKSYHVWQKSLICEVQQNHELYIHN